MSGSPVGGTSDRRSGVSVVASCSACTAGRSALPAHAQRPTMEAMRVGNLIAVASPMSPPSQSGGTSRKSRAPVPVARLPTYAKLFVHASTNCRT